VGHLGGTRNTNPDPREPVEPLYPAAELHGVIPADKRKPYDVREAIARIVDASELDEFSRTTAPPS